MSSSVLPIFSSKSVIVSGLIFRSLIQFEFIFVYSVRKYYNFILLHVAVQGSNGETDIENRLMDMGREEERVRCMERVTWKLTLPFVKQIANGNLLYGSGTGALYQPRGLGWGGRWERISKWRGCMYTYD